MSSRIKSLQRRMASRTLLAYLLYLLPHILFAPVLAVRSVLRSKRRKYQGQTWTRFIGGNGPREKNRWVVVFAAGLGEFRAATTLAQELEANGIPTRVLVENTDWIERQFPGAEAGMAPFNSPVSALLFLLRWKPRAILSIEFLDNHHLKYLAAVCGVPMVVVNVSLTEEVAEKARKSVSRRWRWLPVGVYAVLHERYRERLERITVPSEQIVVHGAVGLGLPSAGDLSASEQQKWRKTLGLKKADFPVVVAGSTWAHDEQQLLSAFERLRREVNTAVLILAPRNLANATVTLDPAGIAYSRRSKGGPLPESRVVLLDTIGELREIYSIADIAFVGGTFPPSNGGHSPSEALAWNTPVTVGPHYAVQAVVIDELVAHGCARVANDEQELGDIWMELAKDRDRLTSMRCAIKEYMLHQRGQGISLFRKLDL
ncbi:MAG TPA: glycosyltransferase N-terminal domain-containing protein [Fimbriimonas sp.]|nr:glycosyltransferase N-terminal domain-containing protein [Fimbriimonas sp.]